MNSLFLIYNAAWRKICQSYPELSWFCCLFKIGFKHLCGNILWQCEKYDRGRCNKCYSRSHFDSVSPGEVPRVCEGWRRTLLIRVEQSYEVGLPHSLSLLSVCLTDPRAPPEFPKEGRASPSPGKYFWFSSPRDEEPAWSGILTSVFCTTWESILWQPDGGMWILGTDIPWCGRDQGTPLKCREKIKCFPLLAFFLWCFW